MPAAKRRSFCYCATTLPMTVSCILARDAVNTTWLAPEHYVAPNAEAALRAAVAGAHWRMTLPAADARHQSGVTEVAFRPDGKTLASAGTDGTVRIWESPTLKPLQILTGHNGTATSVAFSPDGKTLASGGGDNARGCGMWSRASC